MILLLLTASTLLLLINRPADEPVLRTLAPSPVLVKAVRRSDLDPGTFTHAIRLRMPESETRSGALAVVQLPFRPLQGALLVPSTALLLE